MQRAPRLQSSFSFGVLGGECSPVSLSVSSCKIGVDGLPGVTSGLETGMAAWSSGSERMTVHTPGSPLAWAQGQ